MRYLCLFILIFLLSCKSNTSQKKKSRYLINRLTNESVDLKDFLDKSEKTFFLVRHAEKELDEKDPGLTEEGKKRAEILSIILDDISIDQVYSSDYNRTKLTAQPVCDKKGLGINLYNPRKLEAFVESKLLTSEGKMALVVGHSNSTPSLLNYLTNSQQFEMIDESDYDNFFVVSYNASKEVKVVNLKFGHSLKSH